MDYSKTLKQIDEALVPPPKTVAMTEAQFEAYVSDQIEKAKKEKEEDYEKSKKRLEHLRSTIDVVSKAMWEGTNGTQSIPVYETPDLTRNSEKSEKEIPPQNMTTQDAAAWAGAGGAQGFSKAIEDLTKNVEGLINTPSPNAAANGGVPPGTQTMTTQSHFNWPGDIADAEFIKEGVSKSAPLWGKDSDKE